MSSEMGTPPVKPSACVPLRVVYFFTSVRHKADFQECLSALIAEHNARAEFDFLLGLQFEGVDLCVDGVTAKPIGAKVRQHWLARLRASVDIAIIAPPFETFSRACHSSGVGPKPFRDATWPKASRVWHSTSRTSSTLSTFLSTSPWNFWPQRRKRRCSLFCSAPRTLVE